MKRGEQKSRHLDSAVGVMRPLVHMLQIMQRNEVTKYSAKPVGTERRMQSTFTKRWVESNRSVTLKWCAETMHQH